MVVVRLVALLYPPPPTVASIKPARLPEPPPTVASRSVALLSVPPLIVV
jgi:hypothetical protein